MKHLLLLLNRYKIIGWVLLIPTFIIGVLSAIFGFKDGLINGYAFAISSGGTFEKSNFFTLIYTDLTFTIFGTLFLIGALIVSFSKLKIEDEFTINLRLNSLLWAVLLNFILLLIAFIFVYDEAFLTVMVYNMFTTLIIFIARFHFILYKSSKYL